MLGWILLGLAAGALVITYWDRIKRWLDTIVADKIEQVFGYGARKRVHHAVSIADRVAGGIRNRIFVYVQKISGKGYDKYEEKEVKIIRDVEDEIVQEINDKGPIIQEFSYTE
jgi:hypothetical protein